MLAKKKGLSSPSGSAWRTENKTAGGKMREVKSLPEKPPMRIRSRLGRNLGGGIGTFQEI